MNAGAPGLLVIDSPQKNLGHNSMLDDPDFADVTVVENFYTYAKRWLATERAGTQLIVVGNSPSGDRRRRGRALDLHGRHGSSTFGLIE